MGKSFRDHFNKSARHSLTFKLPVLNFTNICNRHLSTQPWFATRYTYSSQVQITFTLWENHRSYKPSKPFIRKWRTQDAHLGKHLKYKCDLMSQNWLKQAICQGKYISLISTVQLLFVNRSFVLPLQQPFLFRQTVFLPVCI